jgi:succinate dehydrogenase hydrophobic anchor subunit
MVAFMLSQSQILILALDVVNFREQTLVDMRNLWLIIYMSGLFMATLVVPFAYFFYETDEDWDYKTRFCTAFRNHVILFIVLSIIHFPMYS